MNELDQYRARAREWLAANARRRRGDDAPRGARPAAGGDTARARADQQRMHEAGFLGITVPVEYGGQGLSAAHERVWREESAGYALPTPGGVATVVTLGIVVPTVLAHGSEAQKREWVPRMLRGEEIWVQLLSEPGAGSDLAGVLTRATREDDAWLLSGTKIWSSGALAADFGICLARTDWDVPKHRGLTCFKVPLRDPRVTVRPVREINGSAEFCEEFLDGVPVGDDMVIGPVDGGWAVANTMLGFERSASRTGSGSGPGGRRRLPSDLLELAAGLTGDGAVRQLIARAHINDVMQGELTKRLMAAMGAGAAPPAAASLIKLGAGVVQPVRAAIAMEIAGRRGVAWAADGDPGHAAALNFLNGRIMSIAGGSNQIQRNIIGERILGLPREPSVDADRPFREVLRDARSWGRS